MVLIWNSRGIIYFDSLWDCIGSVLNTDWLLACSHWWARTRVTRVGVDCSLYWLQKRRELFHVFNIGHNWSVLAVRGRCVKHTYSETSSPNPFSLPQQPFQNEILGIRSWIIILRGSLSEHWETNTENTITNVDSDFEGTEYTRVFWDYRRQAVNFTQDVGMSVHIL